MIGCGLVLLSREYNNPVHLTWRQWSLITIGGVLIVAAFMWDSETPQMAEIRTLSIGFSLLRERRSE